MKNFDLSWETQQRLWKEITNTARDLEMEPREYVVWWYRDLLEHGRYHLARNHRDRAIAAYPEKLEDLLRDLNREDMHHANHAASWRHLDSYISQVLEEVQGMAEPRNGNVRDFIARRILNYLVGAGDPEEGRRTIIDYWANLREVEKQGTPYTTLPREGQPNPRKMPHGY